ncbi:MAG: metal-sensitive transcriptional regulator [Bacteriovoracia bacterium]
MCNKNKTEDLPNPAPKASLLAPQGHACHLPTLKRLKRARGQVEGIEKMVSEGRYCVDILYQIQAAVKALQVVQGIVLEGHFKQCLKNAALNGQEEVIDEKISELLSLSLKMDFQNVNEVSL